jgi:hypothetical protein
VPTVGKAVRERVRNKARPLKRDHGAFHKSAHVDKMLATCSSSSMASTTQQTVVNDRTLSAQARRVVGAKHTLG